MKAPKKNRVLECDNQMSQAFGRAMQKSRKELEFIPNKTPCAIDKCVFELSDIDKIGESLFLTHKETEKKLEELKNEI